MSATDDYTIESSTRYNIETSNELLVSRIGEFYGYEDTNIDPAGILLPNTSILVTNFQVVPTSSAPFTGKLFYVVDNDGEAIATQITTLPFRLSDISNCRIRIVADNNEDGYVKMTFLFYSSILATESFIVETNPSYISNSAYTKDYCAIQWNYTHINYAPTINTSVNIDISATSVEKIKTESDGITVASIIGRGVLGYAEPNSLDTRGLALVGASYLDGSGNNVPSVGIWQYKTSAASSWSDILFDQQGKAYYFKEESGYSLRFYPIDNKAVFARINFRAWDSYSGAEGYQAALASGGNAPTSSNIASLTIPIEKVNYKPILKNTSYTAPSIDEDLADVSNGGVVLNTAFFDAVGLDADTDPKRGIVVTGVNDNGNGSWQFYNGTVWTDISKAALNAIPSRPLHLAETTSGVSPAIRFRPAKDKNGTATFTYSAWSQLNGLDNYTYAALDGSMSYSDESAVATLTITAVEDPPDFSGNKLNLLVRSYNQGVLPADVSGGINVANTLLPNYTIVDVDSSANELGIVLTGFDISGDVSGVSFNAADFRMGFNATANEWAATNTEITLSSLVAGKGVYVNRSSWFRIRTPANFVGRLIFTFYLWNEKVLDSSITNKNRIVDFNYAALTNKEHYSVSSASFRVFFSDINDPPVLVSPNSINLNTATGSPRTQLEDTTAPIETTIIQIINRLTITDADSATKIIPVPGLALYDVAVNAPDFASKSPPVSNYGSWYIRKGDGSLVALTGLTRSNAYHVAGNDGSQIFFSPADDIYGTFTIKALVWDRSNEEDVAVHSYADASNNTETSSYSVASLDLQLTVTPVNDQPSVQPANVIRNTIIYPTVEMTTVSRTISPMANMGDKLSTLLQRYITPYVIDKDPLDVFGIVIMTRNNYFDYSILEIGGVPQWIPVTTTNIHLRPNDNPLTGQVTRIRVRPIPTLPQSQTINVLVWDMTNGITNGSITPINNSTKSYSTQTVRIRARAI
jgi:hypothetical protein